MILLKDTILGAREKTGRILFVKYNRGVIE